MLSATLRSSSKLHRLQHVIPPPSIPATHRHARTRFGKARVKALVFTSDEEAEMATRMPQYASRRARDFTGELDADVEYVASYDWDAEAKKPTITVPGHPPILKGFEFYIPPSLASPRQTDADDPRRPSAHWAGRRPVSYLPRATLAASDALGTSSSIDWRALDFIVDYGVIRKIMLRVQLGDRAEMTELALERLGDKTFVLNSGPKDEFSLGFGHARRGLYELAVDGKPGRTHIRVIRTTFFGMNMLVSFPVYACKPDTSSLSTAAAAAEEAGGTNSDLLGLKIVRGGFGASVPHSALANFSIPTHDHRNVGEFRSLLPHRMIAHSFLPAYPIMYHYPGALDEHMIMQISEIDLVRGYALEYRSRQRNAFERFARVFEIVRKEARRFGEGARCRVRMDGRSVVVDQWKKPPVLVPPKARARFE